MGVFEYYERVDIVLSLHMSRREAAKDAWFMRGRRLYSSYRDTYSKARALHIKAKTAFEDGNF